MSATGRTPNYELGLYEFGNTLNYADYNAALSKIDSQMKTNADASSANNEKITENSALLNTLSDNMSTIQGQVGSAITKNEEQDTRITDAEEKVAELETKHNALTSTVGENVDDITDNVQKIQDLEQKNATLENTLNTTSGKVDLLNTSMDSANASITQNTNSITALSAKVTAAETSLETVSVDITEINDTLVSGLGATFSTTTTAGGGPFTVSGQSFTIRGLVPGNIYVLNVPLQGSKVGTGATGVAAGSGLLCLSNPMSTLYILSGIVYAFNATENFILPNISGSAPATYSINSGWVLSQIKSKE